MAQCLWKQTLLVAQRSFFPGRKQIPLKQVVGADLAGAAGSQVHLCTQRGHHPPNPPISAPPGLQTVMSQLAPPSDKGSRSAWPARPFQALGFEALICRPVRGWQDLLVYRPQPVAPGGCVRATGAQESPHRTCSPACGWARGGPLLSTKCLGISHLMRTKGINWWFRPNETAVQINSPHQQKQTEPLNESAEEH